MAGGFSTPLFALGLGSVTDAGFSSPLYVLGTGAVSGVGNSGFRSPLPFWNMGTTAAPTGNDGFRTPLPFWNAGTTPAEIGGRPWFMLNMGTYPYVPPETTAERNRGSHGKRRRDLRHARILAEDEEILAVIMAWYETKH